MCEYTVILLTIYTSNELLDHFHFLDLVNVTAFLKEKSKQQPLTAINIQSVHGRALGFNLWGTIGKLQCF